jgi:hypothetical protein
MRSPRRLGERSSGSRIFVLGVEFEDEPLEHRDQDSYIFWLRFMDGKPS